MGRKSCTGVVKSGSLYTMGLGGSKAQGKFLVRFSYAKEDSKETGGLAIVELRLFFPLAKH